MATLDLIDGAAILDSYRLSIVPPASARLGVLFDQKLVLASGPPLRLPARVLVRGTILNSDGKPLGNVAVTARPSLRFLWTLEAIPQAFVSSIDHFGASAPGKVALENFGYTADNVADRARQLMAELAEEE